MVAREVPPQPDGGSHQGNDARQGENGQGDPGNPLQPAFVTDGIHPGPAEGKHDSDQGSEDTKVER